MRWLSLALVLVGVSGCSGGARVATDGPLVVDAVASDGPSVDCAALDEAGCLARSDCHAGYDVTVCDNPLGYCAAYQRCVDGAAVCVGEAACDRIPPTCLGPYVHTYVGGCYGPCARADQCAGCRADKLRFTQATGCENDGSVEFCVPPALEAAVRVIAPTVTCAPRRRPGRMRSGDRAAVLLPDLRCRLRRAPRRPHRPGLGRGVRAQHAPRRRGDRPDLLRVRRATPAAPAGRVHISCHVLSRLVTIGGRARFAGS
jgi:hypothetical protein